MKPRLDGFFSRALTLLALALMLRAPASAAPWADLPSDIPQDPALVLGALPNGLRYALLPNAEPAGRVSLRLLVSVGSIHENDNERGLAHFVEHMAFRGTRSHPHGGIIATLERMGVSFGPDSAAFTNYDCTIYHIDLPDASVTTVREALRIFREYASNIEFAAKDIERERGVILSEMAMRDTGEARAGLRSLAFVWPTARQLSRHPIGLEKQIRRFTQKQFRAFHDAWYRPERIAIIAVGELEPEKLRAMISDQFAGLAARAPARPEPSGLAPLPPGKKLRSLEIHTDSAIPGLNISFSRSYPEKIARHTRETRALLLHESLACHMLQHRILLDSRKPGAITGAPAVMSMQTFPGMRTTHFSISGSLDKWDPVIRYAEQTLRQAREHGFTQGELDAAKLNYANNWRQAARSAPTRRSENLCAELAGFFMQGGGFSTPEAIWQAHEKLLADTTLDDCRAALARLWGDDPPRTFIAANANFSKIKQSQIEKTLADSRKTPVAPPAKTKHAEFTHRWLTRPSGIKSTKTIDAHGIHLVAFDNNTLLNHKRTDFEKDSVLINMRVGSGRITQPRHKPGIDLLATCAFLAGGTTKHGFDSITEIAEQHMLGMDFRIDDDAFNFSVHCPASETAIALRMLAAYITDANYYHGAKTLATPWLTSIYQQQLTSPGARINAIMERAITGDPRFGWPDFAEPMSRIMPEIKEWMHPSIETGCIETSIVGDISLDDALAAMRQSLAAIPPRHMNTGERIPADGRTINFVPPKNPITVEVPASLKQGAFAYVWPVPVKDTLHNERACHLLAHALANAARICLRDELGAAYDVSAGFVQHDGFDTFNYFLLRAEVDKTGLDKAAAAVRKSIERIAANGITEDEFLRAKKPFAENYDRSMRTNIYWGFTVLRDAQTNPLHLDAMQSRKTDIASITREEVNALAAQHLRWDFNYLFKTTPAKR